MSPSPEAGDDDERPDVTAAAGSTARADVAVVGLGRIGLPLALAFADRGLSVIGVDRDPERLAAVRDGTMPFAERGTQELLERVNATGGIHLADSEAAAAGAGHIVLTLGTPALPHVEIDISQIRAALDALIPRLEHGHSLVLRSTVAPGTTEWVAGYVEQRAGLRCGTEVFVSHVPERIAENHFLEEIESLPHIVGGVDVASADRATSLFGVFGSAIERTTALQAELAKIWTNIYRYANFALPNLLMMDCEQYGANVFEVIDLINRDYPRGGIARPGLTAGTCLRKDFAFSEERSRAPGMLLAVSRVNESVPSFLVDGIKARTGALRDRRVAVLGLTFKANSDDLRDSLAFKLVRLLERELAEVRCHDAVLGGPDGTLEEVLDAAEIIVCATDHDAYRDPAVLRTVSDRAAPGHLLVDPWDALGTGAVFGGLAATGAAIPAPAGVPAAADR